ncbi:TIGR02530 family flagellar biosynthesis protein [Caldalkalibacillus mannanilyticus]|uniref:TIGR02530 family flagellar biosynthesis protein n=1 Tax=Caldalkalibacillus mannanilyticus TaxID=1418 RepID=UPI000468A9E8|nr:TIGR02530 family flagellar biosynthesis protein [Caldalkalibacillus mannanilyticus]
MAQFKIGNSYYPKSPILPNHHPSRKINHVPPNSNSFAQHLQDTLIQQQPKLKFSQHATARLEERGIDLSTDQMARLQDGMMKAKEKGSKESLLLLEGLAFVVSVKNNTVITAMDQKTMNDQIITNIDSAVIL